jgi:hypothetical protein
MKNCLECGDAIAGREDKKFCCDGCRNSHNNKINKDTNNFMRNINNTLRKNYRILSEINTDRKTKTTRSQLLKKGFDFEFYTNQLQTKAGKTYYFVYNQGYIYLDKQLFIIVKKDFNT